MQNAHLSNMEIFSRLFPTNEVRSALRELERISELYDETFIRIKYDIEKSIHKNSRIVSERIRVIETPEQFVYGMIANVLHSRLRIKNKHYDSFFIMYNEVLDKQLELNSIDQETKKSLLKLIEK